MLPLERVSQTTPVLSAPADCELTKDQIHLLRLRGGNDLKAADVVVHGYRPGALDGLGFGPEERRKLNPRLIDISLCAYGWTGP